MVLPSPDLQRRINNTDNIVASAKAHLVPGLFSKYPGDYLDLDTINNLMIKKPWIRPMSSLKDTCYKLSNQSSQLKSLAIIGGDEILVICIDFSDRPHTMPISAIQNRFFGISGNTFRNYYSENSHGLYIPDGIVIGWYRAPHTYAYYRDDPNTSGCDYGKGFYPHNDQKLFEDALDLINSDPNITLSTLSGLDIDGDGLLNRVIIVHAGGDASYGGNCNEIWAVTWVIAPKSIKDKTFKRFSIVSEYISISSDTQRSGIDCHEFAHILGLPDLYDYSGNTNGVGQWSLMDGGAWGNDLAITPMHLDAWSKSVFGWVTIWTNQVGTISISNVENYHIVYIYTTSNPGEYFILENRQKIGFDSLLPGDGLLIWHINENYDQYSDINCHTVSLVQADNRKDLENKANNGDNGDPYPGASINRSFGVSTSPSISMCNNNTWNILINNISNSGAIMNFDSILPTGSVMFHTTPTGADIYIDTTFKGTTDITTGILGIYNIPIGITNCTIKKTGFIDYTDKVNIIENGTIYKLVTMTPAIVATNITANPTSCLPPCDMSVYVSWTNNGITTASFYPAIDIDGQRLPFVTPEVLESIDPGLYLIKHFSISGFDSGNHTICPNPN